MEDNPYQGIAEALRGAQRGQDGALCLGRVASWPTPTSPDRPRKIVCQGNTQEREDLLSEPGLLPYGLSDGDQVLLLPVEEAQRYIIICKVVDV